MASEFELQTSIPFPEDVKTVTLETISLQKLIKGDDSEKSRLFEASKTRGFFYLDFEGTESLYTKATKLGHIAEASFQDSEEEKTHFEFKPGMRMFGYKRPGAGVVDTTGTRDKSQFWNIVTHDIIKEQPEMPWSTSIQKHQEELASFAKSCHKLGLSILDIIAAKLDIPSSAIANTHRIAEPGESMIRFTRGPPRKSTSDPEISIGGHTDFGTITILFNWLGGLQVWSRSGRNLEDNLIELPDGEWLWVKPKPGHAIVNFGDAVVKYTNGVICSGRHRTVPAPGEQGKLPRYSIVYFVRPEDESLLKTYESEKMPKERVSGCGADDVRTKDWVMNRLNQMRGLAPVKMARA